VGVDDYGNKNSAIDCKDKGKMKRGEFIKNVGLGTLALCSGCALYSCGSNEPEPKIDFKIDLSLPENAALTAAGGSLSKDGVIIICLATDDYKAFNRACTHQGTPVNYQTSTKKLVCPNHGSEFDPQQGLALNGPATVALRKFNTEILDESGKKMLRVFA
jgi:cytochrome b6-f complex iron-sulfur subunit